MSNDTGSTGVKRRDFLKVLGAAGATVSAVGCTSEKVGNLIPYLVSPDETVAGADSGNQFGDYNALSGISGTFFPVPGSSPLAHLASLFPMQHLVKAAFAAFDLRSAGAGILLSRRVLITDTLPSRESRCADSSPASRAPGRAHHTALPRAR